MYFTENIPDSEGNVNQEYSFQSTPSSHLAIIGRGKCLSSVSEAVNHSNIVHCRLLWLSSFGDSCMLSGLLGMFDHLLSFSFVVL